MSNPTPEELLAMMDEQLEAKAPETGPEPEQIQGDPHPEETNEDLFVLHRQISEGMRTLKESLWLIERSLTLRMKAIGASVLETPAGRATLKENVQWDEETLLLIRKEGLMAPLEFDGFLNDPKPRTFDKRKLAPLAKRGGRLKEIIESARKVTGESLVIRSTDDGTDTELAAD